MTVAPTLRVPQPDVWADGFYIEDALMPQILKQPAVLLLDKEPEWVAWYLTPGGAALMGNRVGSIQTELRRHNRMRKSAALGSDTIAAFEAAC